MSNFIRPTTATPLAGTTPLAAPMMGTTTPLAAPMMGTTTPLAAPMMGTGAPLMPGAAATTVLPATAGTGLMGHQQGEKLSWHEKRAIKHQEKAIKHENKAALKHSHGHQQHGLPLAGNHATTGLPLVGNRGVGVAPVMRGPTNVVEHQPIIEREVVVERPVEVRREHHIQPVIHEREHQIQPVIRTEVTTERRDMLTERNVMLPAMVEQPRSLASTGVLHQTTTDQRGLLPGHNAATGTPGHATMGQKIKGTVKEVQGSVTHNPMKKEEGRLLKQGIEPTTAGLGTTGSTMGNTRF